MAQRGLTRNPMRWAPRFLRQFYDLSYLFPFSVKYLSVYYVQAQMTEGGAWVTLPMEDEYFRMPSFGYRSRLSRFSELYVRYRNNGQQFAGHAELVEWVYRRFLRLHPDRPAPTAIRIVDGLYATGNGGTYGPWRKPPLESITARLTHVVYEQPVAYRSR